MATQRTVQIPVQIEIPRVKGSRFLARLAPASTPEAAEAVVAQVRAEEAGATHHAWAWRGEGTTGEARSSDDGEVRGTAGPPILAHLGGAELCGVVLVVTRYYGGTNLGKGGLIRAYGAAAAAAIAAAEVVEVPQVASLRIGCTYSMVGPLEGVIAQHGGTVHAADYGAEVWLTVGVPVEQAPALREALRERSGGQALVEEG